jgi:hypothetical protein
VRVEAKAVGLLQIVAIVFAVIALVLPRKAFLLRLLLSVAIAFLASATWGALEVLRAREQRQVLAQTAESDSAGLVETATAAFELQFLGIRLTNFVDGMIEDLVVAAVAAGLALILVVWGVGDTSPATSAPPAPGPVSASTTTTVGPTTTR